MQTDSVRLFVDVIKQGSFAAVARQRDIDPSSISRSIAALEAELGFLLFHRVKRKLAPTEAGSHYYEQVKVLIGDLERAGEEALDLVREPKGMLRVTACTSFGQRVLAPLLPKLFAAYPGIELDLVLSDSQIDLVAEEVDLAIRFGAVPESGGVAEKLAPRRFRVCASPDYVRREGAPKHPEELQRHECLLFPMPGYRTCWLFRHGDDAPFSAPVRGRILISHGQTMTACALAGLGPALLPDWLCDKEIEEGALLDLFPDYECAAGEFDTAAWIVRPSRGYLPIKVRAFIDFLKQEIGGNA